MELILTMGTEGKHLSTDAIEKINELWGQMPNDDAPLQEHEEYMAKLKLFKAEFAKIYKHINRQYVIGNGQRMKAKMREHIDAQLSIFDFGRKTIEEEDE